MSHYRSRSRSLSPTRSINKDQRDRSRSPVRNLPTGPRSSLTTSHQSQSQHNNTTTTTSSNSLQQPLIEYQITLPQPALIRFLIGQGGARSKKMKAYSDCIRLTFCEEGGIPGQIGTGVGVGKFRGTVESIRLALAFIRDELAREQEIKGSEFECGDYDQWTAYDEARVVYLGKSKEEYFKTGANIPYGIGKAEFEAMGGRGGEWSLPSDGPRQPSRTESRHEESYRRNSDRHETSYRSNQNGGGAAAYQQQPNFYNQGFEDKDRREKEKGPDGPPTVTIEIPVACVSSLIGTKGSVIRGINEACGGYCRVDRSGPLPLLNIFADNNQIPSIMQMIDEIISRADSSWTGGMNQPNQAGQQSYRERSSAPRDRRSPSPRGGRDDYERSTRDEPRERVREERKPARESRDQHYYEEDKPSRSSTNHKTHSHRVTEDELLEILDNLPEGMLQRVLARKAYR